MSPRNTSVADKIQLLIQCSTRTESQALNVTQGHKPSYPTSYKSIPNDGDNLVISTQGFSAMNTTQGKKASYTTGLISIPN